MGWGEVPFRLIRWPNLGGISNGKGKGSRAFESQVENRVGGPSGRLARRGLSLSLSFLCLFFFFFLLLSFSLIGVCLSLGLTGTELGPGPGPGSMASAAWCGALCAVLRGRRGFI